MPEHPSAWPDQRPVHLRDGPLAGHTVPAASRAGMPPTHLYVHARDPSETRAGSEPPAELPGWLLYADAGHDSNNHRWDFMFVRTADAPEDEDARDRWGTEVN